MDELKKFYQENPEERDVFHTDYDSLWEGVDDQLNHNQQRKRRNAILRIAASILVLAGIFTWVGKSGKAPVQITEAMETESYYTGLIENKMVLINAQREFIDPVIIEDLEILDTALEELKDDLKDDAHNEQVIRAMVKNYQFKLEILEQILEQIEESENVETNI